MFSSARAHTHTHAFILVNNLKQVNDIVRENSILIIKVKLLFNYIGSLHKRDNANIDLVKIQGLEGWDIGCKSKTAYFSLIKGSQEIISESTKQ